jgi:hypothetical protein
MDGNVRRTRFEARVDVERDFLGTINTVFGSYAPLAGMTMEAIVSWKVRASDNHNEAKIDGIAKILLEASARASLLADNSRDVFEEDRRPKQNSMLELRELLQIELARS